MQSRFKDKSDIDLSFAIEYFIRNQSNAFPNNLSNESQIEKHLRILIQQDKQFTVEVQNKVFEFIPTNMDLLKPREIIRKEKDKYDQILEPIFHQCLIKHENQKKNLIKNVYADIKGLQLPLKD